MATKYTQGASRVLNLKVGSLYKPIACLTETSFSSVLEMIERVTICSAGKKESTPSKINRSISFSGIIMDTVEFGGGTVGSTIKELIKIQEDSVENKTVYTWQLSRGAGNVKNFEAILSDVSDSFPAEGDATFSGTLTINKVV